jgi:hypothetical protein
MIQYPTSNLYKKIRSDKSSCDCTSYSSSQSNSSFCSKYDNICNKFDRNEYNSSKYCAKEIFVKNKCNCNRNCNCDCDCDCDCDDNDEKVIEFGENHTNGILKITKIKGNLGTGILKIINGNCINLNSDIFRGLLSLSIINNTRESVNINYNKNIRFVLNTCHFIIFKRKNDCKWEIMMMYEIKNKYENYYYEGKKCDEKFFKKKDCDSKETSKEIFKETSKETKETKETKEIYENKKIKNKYHDIYKECDSRSDCSSLNSCSNC